MSDPSEFPMLMQTAFDGLVALTALLRSRHLLGPSFGPLDRPGARFKAKHEPGVLMTYDIAEPFAQRESDRYGLI
jgi:hypothetical protein